MAQLSNSHKMLLHKKRDYAARITSVLLELAKQGIALQGQDAREKSAKGGNFLGLSSLFSLYDEIIAKINKSINKTPGNPK